MKKLISVLLALALTLITCCAAVAGAADLTGEWYASMFGVTLCVTLNADGTYVMDLSAMGVDEPEVGAWSFDGAAVTMDEGTEGEITLPYDAQTNTFGDESMVFSRELAPAYDAPAAIENATLDLFEGSWKAVSVSMFGLTMPADETGMVLSLDISGEKVALTMEVFGDAESVDMPVAFADGTLTVSMSEDDGAVEFTVRALENGTLSATFIAMEQEVTFYLEKAEAASAE